jgi:hypothetical protein
MYWDPSRAETFSLWPDLHVGDMTGCSNPPKALFRARKPVIEKGARGAFAPESLRPQR